MNDTINQTRLSLRLDTYLRAYIGKNIKADHLLNDEWKTTWLVADSARADKTLTPELVDDVRIVLNKL
ncbi:hypothetical protein ccbrp13_10770 [Ktedonobacteria bacterium brp13]|nr:hypothetical protein ccbrp13_10770 [Ktedonobacteria bacterium brp13]